MNLTEIKTCKYFRLHIHFIGEPGHVCIMGFKKHRKPCARSCDKAQWLMRRVSPATVEHYPTPVRGS